MKLVKTDEYLLLLDPQAKREDGKPYLYKDDLELRFFSRQYNQSAFVMQGNFPVIAHYPLQSDSTALDLPLLPNPFQEVNIESIVKRLHGTPEEHLDNEEWREIDFGVKCYQVAQSHGTYTLKDMTKAFEYGKSLEPYDSFELFIESLSSHKLPKFFIPSNAGDHIVTGHNGLHNEFGTVLYHTSINEEGKEVILGEYVY